jgi:hypothetical protein
MEMLVQLDVNEEIVSITLNDTDTVTAYRSKGNVVKFKGLNSIIDDDMHDIVTKLSQDLLDMCKRD